MRPLPLAEYTTWRARFDVANRAMVDRQQQKEACYDLMERDLQLLGATAIEDRLQVSGVKS
jgi:magnesium-transporting ATPase (P-type)